MPPFWFRLRRTLLAGSTLGDLGRFGAGKKSRGVASDVPDEFVDCGRGSLCLIAVSETPGIWSRTAEALELVLEGV